MKSILVIEDNEEVRENLEEILELAGYEVNQAANGKLGVQQAIASPPDLIICDIMMPELDGFGVLNILSKRPATADIPFIFLTAKSEKTDFRRGMDLGADDYLTKPFYKDELLKVVETRLKKSERLKKNYQNTPEGLQAFIDEARGYAELKALSNEQKVMVLPARRVLFQDGGYPRYLYMVKNGKVKIYNANDDGKEFILKVFTKGDFFGYIPLIQNKSYHYSAATMEETELCMIPRDDFIKLISDNRNVAARFIKMLADNIDDKEDQLLHLAYDSIRRRVADTLLKLYRQEGQPRLDFLRRDLAQMVGTAKESVVRTLTDFKQEKLIDIQDGTIIVVDEQGLENLFG
jgi:CRP-like cAMP-binding protein/CheY-like chemotaxis protein